MTMLLSPRSVGQILGAVAGRCRRIEVLGRAAHDPAGLACQKHPIAFLVAEDTRAWVDAAATDGWCWSCEPSPRSNISCRSAQSQIDPLLLTTRSQHGCTADCSWRCLCGSSSASVAAGQCSAVLGQVHLTGCWERGKKEEAQ